MPEPAGVHQDYNLSLYSVVPSAVGLCLMGPQASVLLPTLWMSKPVATMELG